MVLRLRLGGGNGLRQVGSAVIVLPKTKNKNLEGRNLRTVNSSGELEFYAPVALARIVLCFRVLFKGKQTSVVFLRGIK